MPTIPDLRDPRYLNEVGWFLHHAEFGRDQIDRSYDDERREYSGRLLEYVLARLGRNVEWLGDKTVVSIGCGCTGDLSAWPALTKIAVDPLLYTYQQLGLLLEDAPGTAVTAFITSRAEDLPLLDDQVDLVVCRNALDHMLDPEAGLTEMWRILKPNGCVYVDVDIGGRPRPDEPVVFSQESLLKLLRRARFDVVSAYRGSRPSSRWREASAIVVARKLGHTPRSLDRAALLRAYESGLDHSFTRATVPQARDPRG